MSRHLVTLAHRRPGLVLLSLLYTVITVLVARSPVTVALCIVLFTSVAVQISLLLRGSRSRADRPVRTP